MWNKSKYETLQSYYLKKKDGCSPGQFNKIPLSKIQFL